MIEYQEKELKEEGRCLSCHRIITNKGSIVCPCCTRNSAKIGGAVLAGVVVTGMTLKNLRKII